MSVNTKNRYLTCRSCMCFTDGALYICLLQPLACYMIISVEMSLKPYCQEVFSLWSPALWSYPYVIQKVFMDCQEQSSSMSACIILLQLVPWWRGALPVWRLAGTPPNYRPCLLGLAALLFFTVLFFFFFFFFIFFFWGGGGGRTEEHNVTERLWPPRK